MQYKKLSFLVFLLFSCSLYGQDTTVIQLPSPIATKTVKTLITEADTTSSIPLQLRLLLEALKIAEKEKQVDHLFFLNKRVGQIYASELLNEQALGYYQKAKKYQTDEKILMGLFLDIATVYDQRHEPDSAALFFNKVLANYELNNNYQGRISIHQKLVDTYHNNQNPEEALSENFKIKQLAEGKKDKQHLPIIYNNIGYNYVLLQNMEKAVEYFTYAEDANLSSKLLDLPLLFTNLGIAYNNIGKLEQALDYLNRAKKALQKNEEATTPYLNHLIAQIYLNNQDIYNAKIYNDLAIKESVKFHQHNILLEAYNTAALIHQDLYEYELAMDAYKKHLNLRDSFRLEDRLRQEQLLQEQLLLERSEKEIRLLLINQEVQELAIQQLRLEKDKIQLEKAKQESELAVLKKSEEARTANLKNAELEKDKAEQELLLTERRLEAELKNRQILELEQEQVLSKTLLEKKESDIAKQKAEALQKQKENELLQANAEIYKQTEALNKLSLESQSARLNFLRGVGGLLLLLSLIILGSLFSSRKKNKLLANKNVEIAKSRDVIESEREKSENLLLNILPKETAKELKESGAATPKYYDKVTILFSDFSGFTRISRHMSPEDLIDELNVCFRAFDQIMDEFGLEKIKTLGDGYMAAGGIPLSNDTNPIDAIQAALKINEFMINRSKEKRAAGITYWDTRIGLHTGKVIAGVVGTRKFAYDIWGDSVNTASRMESGGQIGKVNISDQTFDLVKDHFYCTYRGEIEIKNRGKIGMYFVDGAKSKSTN